MSTILLMNKKGINSFTTRDVAAEEGVTEAAIFKQYRSKRELIKAVVKNYAMYDDDIINSIELKKMSSIESIFHYFELYATYYEGYSDITVLTSNYDQLRYIDEIKDLIYEIEKKREVILYKLIKTGMENNEFKSDLEVYYLVNALIGIFVNIVNKWRACDYNFPFKDEVQKNLEQFIVLIRKEKTNGQPIY